MGNSNDQNPDRSRPGDIARIASDGVEMKMAPAQLILQKSRRRAASFPIRATSFLYESSVWIAHLSLDSVNATAARG